MNNNNPIQTVNIDKEQVLKEIAKLTENVKLVKKASRPEIRDAYLLGVLAALKPLERALPEHELWMRPGSDAPKTIADALEAFRAELKSP